jgi:hypothetical protein
MTLNSRNEDLSNTHEEFLSILYDDGSLAAGNDCVFFVHNPTVEQFGAWRGVERAIASKEQLFEKLLLNIPESGTDCLLNQGGNCVLVMESSSKLAEGVFSIGNDRKRPRDEDMTTLMPPYVVKMVGTLPEDAARKYFVIQVVKEGEINEETASKVARLA